MVRSGTVTRDFAYPAQSEECRDIYVTGVESRCKLGSGHGELLPRLVCRRCGRCVGKV